MKEARLSRVSLGTRELSSLMYRRCKTLGWQGAAGAGRDSPGHLRPAVGVEETKDGLKEAMPDGRGACFRANPTALAWLLV